MSRAGARSWSAQTGATSRALACDHHPRSRVVAIRRRALVMYAVVRETPPWIHVPRPPNALQQLLGRCRGLTPAGARLVPSPVHRVDAHWRRAARLHRAARLLSTTARHRTDLVEIDRRISRVHSHELVQAAPREDLRVPRTPPQRHADAPVVCGRI